MNRSLVVKPDIKNANESLGLMSHSTQPVIRLLPLPLQRRGSCRFSTDKEKKTTHTASKSSVSFLSFKITVVSEVFDTVVDGKLWPAGSITQEFVSFLVKFQS